MWILIFTCISCQDNKGYLKKLAYSSISQQRFRKEKKHILGPNEPSLAAGAYEEYDKWSF